MSSLSDIKVTVASPSFRHNALPILHEIRHALVTLAESGAPTTIDLRAIPFGPGDEDMLLEVLGRGEVNATVDALGPTRVWETGFSGVWVLDYRNTEDTRIAFQIEVTETPSILHTQMEDVRSAVDSLQERLKVL